MVEQIIKYLNAKIATTGHFHTTYCLVEKKREPREDGDVVYPATYTGAGELEMVEFDSAGFAYFRKDGDITQAVEGNEFGQKQLYNITIPLRLVAMVRRQDIVTDDAYSPDRLARDIATLLTFKNGDLRTGLNANRVLVTAANWQTDPEQIWSDETEGTGRIEPDYSRAFIAMSVTVEVLADEGCIRNACEFDPDILHLFDFCKPSVVARLTDRQVDCLLDALPFPCEPATYTLINTATPPATLDSGSIPSGVSDTIVAPAVTVLRDGQPFAVVPSSETVDVPSDCPPCADGTVELNGDEVATVASGGTVNIMVEQDGNPVGAFDPNTNSWVIPPCGAGGDVTVTVSDATPSTGDTITITATPTGFTANNYLFFTYDGLTITEIVEQSSGVYSWFVDRAGTYDIYAVATDGTVKSWGKVGIVAASGFILDQIPTQPIWAVSLRRLRSAYTGPAATVRRSSDNATQNIGFIGEDLDTAALTAFVGVGNGFTATLYDQIAGVNPFQTTAGNQPRMVLSGAIDLLGGKPTIVFNGSSHQMPMPLSVSCAHGFVVARKASNTNLAQYVLGGTSQGLSFGGTFTVNTANINVISPGGNLISTVNNTLPHQVSFRLGGSGAGRLRVDGVTEAIGTTSATMNINRIGTTQDSPLRHIGDFSEAILYSSALSDADELVIENNQRAYYGL
jgi:hypothetical protein